MNKKYQTIFNKAFRAYVKELTGCDRHVWYYNDRHKCKNRRQIFKASFLTPDQWDSAIKWLNDNDELPGTWVKWERNGLKTYGPWHGAKKHSPV